MNRSKSMRARSIHWLLGKRRAPRAEAKLAAAVARGAENLERLEPRQLLSGSPTATIAGPATVDEGSNYVLSLSTSNLGSLSVDHWTVDWGDGDTTVPGSDSTADHVYADGPNNYTIEASATLSNSTVVEANQSSTTVSDGSLDSSYGVGGKVITSFSPDTGVSASVALLDDGQSVVAGMVGNTATLIRYNTDGSIDTSFGTDGQVTIPGATSITTVLDEHVTDPNNPSAIVERLVVAGNIDNGVTNTYESAVWRFNLDDSAYSEPDGSVDTTFGTAGVVVLPGFLDSVAYPHQGSQLVSATLSPSGQIVTVGMAFGGPSYQSNGQWLAVARLNSDGSLDTSFNATGEQTETIGLSNVNGSGYSIQPFSVMAGADGSVVAMAYGSIVGGNFESQLLKFSPTGAIDTSFGSGGIAPANPGNDSQFDVATLDNNGNILLGGYFHEGSNNFFALARYDYSTGAIDTSFGNGDTENNYSPNPGEEATFLGHNATVTSIAVMANGQIVAAGEAFNDGGLTPITGNSDLAVARYNTNGFLDTTFASSGFTRIDYEGGSDTAVDVAIQTDTKILIAGFSDSGAGSNDSWTLTRLGQTTSSGSTPVNVSVLNVPPTAQLSAAPSSNPEGTAITVTASATDPGSVDQSVGFTYTWTISQTHDSVTIANYAIGSAGPGLASEPISFTPDDDGTYVVSVTATDKDGGVSTPATESISVYNVPPTASLSAAPSSNPEGTAISITGSATDPSSVDQAAGFTFAWSISQTHGSATITDYASGSAGPNAASDPVTFTPDDDGTYVVTLTATDKDGGVSTPATESISVYNVPPTAALSAAPSSNPEGTAISITGTATDPSSVDELAGFTFAWSVSQTHGSATITNYASGSAGPGAASDPITFTPDDDGSYVVTLTATDKDGGTSTAATETIAVYNVAPTAALSAAPSSNPEGTAISITGTATDPSSVDELAGFTFAWSVSQTHGSATITNYASGTAGPGAASDPITFTPDDDGTYAVTLTATDKDGGTSTAATETIAVYNVAPTAALSAAPSSNPEGTAISITGSARDPSSVDQSAGFTYVWTVSKTHGSTTTANYATGSAGPGAATDPISFTPNQDGTYVVTLTATDKDGAVSGAVSESISVYNVTPVVSAISTPAEDVRYQTANFSSSFTDPGTAESHTVTWNFGDGSAAVTTSLGAGVTGAVNASHIYTATGTYTITLTITDSDGAVGTKTASLKVDAADIQTDPATAGKTALFVGGTTGANVITVVPNGSSLEVLINASTYTGFSPTGRIVVFGGGTGDIIQVSSAITAPTELYGGSGVNYIKGGDGPNIEVGGPQSDILVAGPNRDILIGAGGGDILIGGSGNDLLIAMSSVYDANPTALEAIQKEWVRTDISFSQQVIDLTQGGGLNGSYVITAATTLNDGVPDILYGGPGSDAFFVDNGDLVLDASGKDQVIDLSWVTV